MRGKASLILAGLLFLVLIATSYASFWQVKKIAMELEQSKFSVVKSHLESELRSQRGNLLLLRDVPPIEAILRARKQHGIDPKSGEELEVWRGRLATIFKAFIVNHPIYYQIRYIDRSGKELVRVEKDDRAVISITESAKLQDKSDRDYVQETLKLKSGEVYYSDVTLNQEFGKIQEPHVPVMRIATPVYMGGEEPVAIIVLNLLAEPLFRDIKSSESGIQRHVVNEKGYYLKHPDHSKTFGFDLGNDITLQQTEPELAELAKSQDHYIRYHEKHGEIDGFQKVHFSPNETGRYWLLVLHVPEHLIFSDVEATLDRMLMISMLIGALLIFLVGWMVTNKIIAPVLALERATRRLQDGDLSARIDPAAVDGEFRTLYSALNAFAENQEQATKRLQDEVDAQTRRLSAVIDHVVDAIITITEDGIITSFNPAARDIFGYTNEEVIGKNVKMLMPEPYHSEHDDYLSHYTSTGERRVIGIGREVTGQRKDGTVFPIDLAINELYIDQQRYFVGIIRNITERKQAEEKIRQMAHYDHLTSLPNRALFADRLQQDLALAKRNQLQVALLFLDLDGFKGVNDALGHEAGDKLLQQVSKRLESCLREADTVARMGGDEFAVILSDVKDRKNAAQKAEEIIASLSTPYPEVGRECVIGCSIGIAFYPADAESQSDLLNRADAAMYSVKADGKNHFRFYQPEGD